MAYIFVAGLLNRETNSSKSTKMSQILAVKPTKSGNFTILSSLRENIKKLQN